VWLNVIEKIPWDKLDFEPKAFWLLTILICS